jgi:hypothetical protein
MTSGRDAAEMCSFAARVPFLWTSGGGNKGSSKLSFLVGPFRRATPSNISNYTRFESKGEVVDESKDRKERFNYLVSYGLL